MTGDFRDPVVHAQTLIRCPSVTPDQAGALDYLQSILSQAGFTCHRLPFSEQNAAPVDNLYARLGDASPHICFAGHIDVVPPGDEQAWTHPPFAAAIEEGILYGRGAVDMKGGIAGMLAAVFRYLAEQKGNPKGSISFLITADEEGPAINGTRKVVEWMHDRKEQPDHCILSEPTHAERMGESIKIGRRGSLNGRIAVHGTQGHVAYPHLADNPLTGLIAVLRRYLSEPLDDGSENFAPSNLEVTSVDTGNPTPNVIPSKCQARFNIRFNDSHTAALLEERLSEWTEEVLGDSDLKYELSFEKTADSFLTRPGPWVEMLADASGDVTGLTPELSTSGGTSDARFIKSLCPVVEYGLVNKTIHKVDEHVPLTHLQELAEVFHGFLRRYFSRM